MLHQAGPPHGGRARQHALAVVSDQPFLTVPKGQQCCECSDESWRKDAKGVLGSLQGLNRSQQRAIATAMSSTFTLWQVSSPPQQQTEADL